MYSWLRTEEDQLYQAPEDDQVLMEYLEGQVAKLEARIAPIERRERQQHEERAREHERDREPSSLFAEEPREAGRKALRVFDLGQVPAVGYECPYRLTLGIPGQDRAGRGRVRPPRQ